MDFTTLSTDLESHGIQGYVPDGRYIDLPLISHIEDNLYVGGCINGVDLGDYFTHIFSMYKWESYRHGENTVTSTVTMYDSYEVDADTAEKVARQVSKAMDEGGNVLVHCQAGINRSNLVAALVLIGRGRTPAEAIDFLRERRGHIVLANQNFERYLRSING